MLNLTHLVLRLVGGSFSLVLMDFSDYLYFLRLLSFSARIYMYIRQEGTNQKTKGNIQNVQKLELLCIVDGIVKQYSPFERRFDCSSKKQNIVMLLLNHSTSGICPTKQVYPKYIAALFAAGKRQNQSKVHQVMAAEK